MKDKYVEWLNSEYIEKKDKDILKNMSEDEIKDAFFDDLSFGTAGIRGKMGLGTNRINKYTIGKVTVGFSNYLNKKYNNPSVVIAYDTRNNSNEYAHDTALILNYYGIKTYLFKEVTSTPELSFAVKYLKCDAGIVITSSHNEKEYNGYKIYNNLGGQIVPPEDDLIINEINDITSFKMIKKAPLNNPLFKGAFLIILNEVMSFIEFINNFNMVGNKHVSIEKRDINYLNKYERKYKEILFVSSSERIDTIVSRITNINRKEIIDKIKSEEIFVNFEVVKSNSYILKENDIFSIRKYGKYKYIGIQKNTKKDNYIIKVKKYL